MKENMYTSFILNFFVLNFRIILTSGLSFSQVHQWRTCNLMVKVANVQRQLSRMNNAVGNPNWLRGNILRSVSVLRMMKGNGIFKKREEIIVIKRESYLEHNKLALRCILSCECGSL